MTNKLQPVDYKLGEFVPDRFHVIYGTYLRMIYRIFHLRQTDTTQSNLCYAFCNHCKPG